VPRDFLWITARNRATGAPVTWGAWSDVGTVSADVIDPASGATVTRTYEGGGAVIAIGNVQLVTGLTVQAVEISLSQLDAGAQQAVRGHDVRRAPVELHRGFLDPDTHRLIEMIVFALLAFISAKLPPVLRTYFDTHMRDSLQTALTNGARKVIAEGLDGEDAIRGLLDYVDSSARDALDHFKPSPAKLRDQAKAKLREVSAPGPGEIR